MSGKTRNAYRILIGQSLESLEKCPFRRARRRWEDNLEMGRRGGCVRQSEEFCVFFYSGHLSLNPVQPVT